MPSYQFEEVQNHSPQKALYGQKSANLILRGGFLVSREHHEPLEIFVLRHREGFYGPCTTCDAGVTTLVS